MKFSIITCTYNSERYIKNNIKSLENQTFWDFEHIFIDGNSTDDTLEIIEEYRKKYPNRVKFYQQKPGWISKAMNEWIRKSKWEYLIHLHSDDSLYEDKVLWAINKYLELNSDIDWVYGKANVVESDGKTSVWIFPSRSIFQWDSKSWFGKYLLKYFNFIPHQALFIKKDVFENFGYFDESISSAMDPDMWLRIRKQTKWSFVDEIVCNYMIRKDAQSSSVKNRKKNLTNAKKIIKRYSNWLEYPIVLIFRKIVNIYNKTLR